MTHRKPLPILLYPLGCLLPRIVLATDYLITPSGDDHAAGTSPGAAWRTIARVNTGSFFPGDHILFQAHQSFPGDLRLGQNRAGQTNAPVIISSFWGGQAELLAGRETGITIESAGWVTISDLTVLGDGRGSIRKRQQMKLPRFEND